MAVTRLDFATVDRLTFRYYSEKKWDSVIAIGRQALRQDIDYYYLRARLGIAYYEKTDYFPASVHLEKAREFNAHDPAIANYLYYALIYTGREEEAAMIRSKMTPEAREAVKGNEGMLRLVHAESGYTLSGDRNPDDLSALMGPDPGKDTVYGERDLYGNSFYANLGLKLRISNSFGISAAYSYLSFNKTKYIRYRRMEDHFLGTADSLWGTMYLYSFPFVTHDTSFTYQVKQHEVHLGASLALPGGFRIMPAVHLVQVGYPVTTTSVHFDTVTNPGYFVTYDTTLVTFPFTRTNYSFARKDTSFVNYVVALGVTKQAGIFKLGLSASWSDLNGSNQLQAGASLTYYPLGSLSLYGTTGLTGFFQGHDRRLLLSQVLGVKITPWMWGEASFYYGDYTNSNIFDGAVVYNNSDIIDYRGGASLLFVLGKHLQLSLIYQYFRKESRQLYYTATPSTGAGEKSFDPQIKNNPYSTNTLIGGITWKL